MKNEFPISNLRAKYADKTADGKDIAEAISKLDAESAKVYYTDKEPGVDFTDDEINEIVDGKYNIICYNDIYYIVFWSSSNDEFGIMHYDVETKSIYNIWYEFTSANEWVIALNTTYTIASLQDLENAVAAAGKTTLYIHNIIVGTTGPGCPLRIVNNRKDAYTNSYLVSNLSAIMKTSIACYLDGLGPYPTTNNLIGFTDNGAGLTFSYIKEDFTVGTVVGNVPLSALSDTVVRI